MPFKVILDSRWDLYAWLGHFRTYFSKFWMRVVWAGNLQHWQSNRKDINYRQKVSHMIEYRMPCWPSSCIVYHCRLFCSLCFSKWLMFLIFWSCRNKQQGMKLFGSLAKHLGNTSAYVACAIQHRCQYSLEIPDEITIKTPMTKCISYFTRPIMWGGPIVVTYHVLATKLQGFFNTLFVTWIEKSEYHKFMSTTNFCFWVWCSG